MSNPFADLVGSDDDQPQFIKKEQNKVKRTHHQRKEFKKKQEAGQTIANTNTNTEPLPERVRDNAKQVRHNRVPRPQKDIGQGHTLDRRSGTGRIDKVRKQGGGRGNVGNMKDQQNQEKYIAKQGQETVVEEVVEQQKPQQPQAPTLDQYYKSRGVQINTSAKIKEAPKKSQVNAQWIKKEKLTVLQTKEDKRSTEQGKIQSVVNFSSTKVAMDEKNLEFVGFGQKKQASKVQQAPKEARGQGVKGKKGSKVILNDDDFPTL